MMTVTDPGQTYPNIPFELREPLHQIDHVISLVKVSLMTKPSCGSKDLQTSHRNYRIQTFSHPTNTFPNRPEACAVCFQLTWIQVSRLETTHTHTTQNLLQRFSSVLGREYPPLWPSWRSLCRFRVICPSGARLRPVRPV